MGKRASILFRKTLPKEDRLELRQFAETLCADVLEGKSFLCLITGDKQLQQLNADFLGHDYPTDVLSFPTGETVQLGEMAISVERAIQQAELHAHTVLDELKILMLHGALHLSGLDHEQDRGQMKRIETKWRKHFGLVSGLIERTK